MIGLHFADRPSVVAADPNRADIACFVGFVRRRASPDLLATIEAWVRARRWPAPLDGVDPTNAAALAWLGEQGWLTPPYVRDPGRVAALLDLPVPIDNWEVFDRLFAWERRADDGPGRALATYLGAAVRSFFAQGGRKCYVVRVGDPWLLNADRGARIAGLIPGYPTGFDGSPLDRAGWRGIAHLFGLPDVSFVCMPDLANAVATDPAPIRPPDPLPPPAEQFVECSTAEPTPPEDRPARYLSAPRCDEQGYRDWARALHLVAEVLARGLREVQLVAAVPIPQAGLPAERDLLAFLARRDDGPLALPVAPGNARNPTYTNGQKAASGTSGLASAFVQLTYPWVRTPGSANLPAGLESPDAVLTGILARSALARGAFRSAAGLHLADVFDLSPALGRDQLYTPHQDDPQAPQARHALVERVSLLGPTPGGLALLSDVTTSLGESYRQAGTNRLVSAIVRAARRLGEDLVFENSGEALWSRLRESLNTLLTGLLRAGALRGATPADAFQVRCDRSTMSQNDLDNGRVIAEIRFEAAAPIESILVTLALDEGGQVSLVG